MPQGKPMPGELYRHFKNKMYQVVALATHSETREPMVVYQALYGDFMTYVRPYDMFISEVDHEKYPHVFQKYRFELVGTTNVTEAELAGKAQPEPADAAEQPRSVSAGETGSKSGTMEPPHPGFAGGAQRAGNPEHIFRERRQSESPQPEVKSEEDELAGVNPALLAFLDTDDFEEKYKILCGLEQRGEVTNHLIDQFAVTLDLVIPEGDADDRFVQLKNCVRTRSHFETNRLR